jgi:hypothetical protein
MTPIQVTSYHALAQEIASIKPLVGDARWEEAAARMKMLAGRLAFLPAACAADRGEIENALSELGGLVAQLQPLHTDVGRLLSAFGGTAQSTVQ